MEELFRSFANWLALLVEMVAVLVVAFGALEAFAKLLWIVITPGATHGERKAIWRRFGMWLLLGLEFELAGDIIDSVISPTWQDVGMLGAIAVIRTFLNYFLEKDLEEAEKSDVEDISGRPSGPSLGPSVPGETRERGAQQ
jgi:uncharacterized membrane protein